MKNVWLATAGGLTASAVIAAAGIAGPLASASAAGAPCTAKTPTIQGHPAMAFCGPATVTLTVAHKTYAFHNGFCAEPIPHSDAFQLSVGTDVPTLGGPNNNAGQPVFSMDFAKAHTTASIADAYFAGHEILANTKITLTGQIPTKGSFTGKYKGASFTGTWNCHGVLVKS